MVYIFSQNQVPVSLIHYLKTLTDKLKIVFVYVWSKTLGPKAIRMMRTSKLLRDYTYLDLDSFSKYCHLLHVLAEKTINDKSRDVRNSPGRQICRHHLSVLNIDNFHWCKYIFILKTLTTCAVRYMEECKLIQTTLFLSLHEKSYFFLKSLWIVCTLSGFNIFT